MDYASVESLIASGKIERAIFSDDAIDGLLYAAEEELADAQLLAESNRHKSAITHSWAACRLMCEAILARQGLKVTASGDKHRVIVDATKATALGAAAPATIKRIDTLRVRRNELEYPEEITSPATSEEAEQFVKLADALVSKADDMLPNLRMCA